MLGMRPLEIGLSVAPRDSEDGTPEISDLLQRIEALLTHHGDVLLFRERELHSMTAVVNRYTKAPVRLSKDFRCWCERC